MGLAKSSRPAEAMEKPWSPAEAQRSVERKAISAALLLAIHTAFQKQSLFPSHSSLGCFGENELMGDKRRPKPWEEPSTQVARWSRQEKKGAPAECAGVEVMSLVQLCDVFRTSRILVCPVSRLGLR
ncbi:unnamed protein product [Rangifer tarandus platyrhynchus]|uniref:Uncharacterized protein n=1 Tax=Rangifer tarandus platyrhynchus TaxID=3082113 RepID=A0ABN8ZDW1_RANTA|nr:unnamed protein product [Rangifer tarandus platyrhynchus]CAI9689117.1 unnamed protein product [Rangifer tarandus platyrhynchus]